MYFDLTSLGDAVFVGDFEPQSAEWHEVRASGVGGSDVAAIVGVSKFTSAYALWCKKSGLIPDDRSDSEAMEWGRLLESVIFEKFARKNPSFELFSTGTWAHKDRPWQLANPDGLIKFPDGEFGILEIKTAKYEDDWIVPAEGVVGNSSGVPRYYLTQVQWYLNIFGLKQAYVAVLFGGSKYREYLVPADVWQQEVNVQSVERFLECVDKGVAPDWDGSKSTFEAVRQQNPDIVDGQVDLGELGFELMSAQSEFEFVEKSLQEVKSKVMASLGKFKNGVVYEGDDVIKVCYRSSRKGGMPFLVVNKLV